MIWRGKVDDLRVMDEKMLVREAGLEPARPKTQVPKTCVSAISPLPRGVSKRTLKEEAQKHQTEEFSD